MIKLLIHKSNLFKVDLCFEIKSVSDKNETDGILLTDIKLIDGKWDSVKKSIKKSEFMINKLPPVLVYATRQPKSQLEVSNKFKTNNIRAYSNNLRQYHIIDMKNIQFNCSEELIPYIAFDTGVEDLQSLRLHKPIISNLISAYQQSTVESMKLNTANNNVIGSKNKVIKVNNHHEESSSSLSAAYLTVRQSLSRTNNKTLLQIREASDALVKSPESQLSYKPMTQNAPPLPSDLSQTMVRSKPM
jgi:hypothetical protein